MPIAIRNYTEYNNVVIFATEIAGLWEFGPVPGMVQEDGSIKNTSMSGTSALVIMSGAKDIESAWEFMKWYTDSKFQVDYSNELVAILGPAAKNTTANMEALEELPWTSREYSQLDEADGSDLAAIHKLPRHLTSSHVIQTSHSSTRITIRQTPLIHSSVTSIQSTKKSPERELSSALRLSKSVRLSLQNVSVRQQSLSTVLTTHRRHRSQM